MTDTAGTSLLPRTERSVADELRSVATASRQVAICATGALLYFAAPVLLPLVLAVFLFYTLDPLVNRLERIGLARGVGATLVVLAVVAVVVGGSVALWPQADAVISKVPLGAQRLRSAFRESRSGSAGQSTLTKVQDAARAIDRAAAETTARMALVIFVAIAFWSWIWGAAGMLLAVPLLMAAKAVCDHVDGLQNVGAFLGE